MSKFSELVDSLIVDPEVIKLGRLAWQLGLTEETLMKAARLYLLSEVDDVHSTDQD